MVVSSQTVTCHVLAEVWCQGKCWEFRMLASLLFLAAFCQLIHEWDQLRLQVTYLKTEGGKDSVAKRGAFCLSVCALRSKLIKSPIM